MDAGAFRAVDQNILNGAEKMRYNQQAMDAGQYHAVNKDAMNEAELMDFN
jgi:hypothetical protein